MAGVLWLVYWIRSFKRLPHDLADDHLIVHFGSFRSIAVPLRSITVRTHWYGADLKKPGVANFVPVAYPNRMATIDPPLAGRKRPISAVAFRVDEPAAFDAAMAAWGVAIV